MTRTFDGLPGWSQALCTCRTRSRRPMNSSPVATRPTLRYGLTSSLISDGPGSGAEVLQQPVLVQPDHDVVRPGVPPHHIPQDQVIQQVLEARPVAVLL